MSACPPLLLVYLGGKLPGYVVANLRYLRRTFPHAEVWLACDSLRAARQARRAGALVWMYRAEPELKARLLGGIGLDPAFRHGFWLNTMLRLWAVAAFAEQHGDAPLIHLEADVWLAPDAPLERWRSLECDLAYPLASAEAGAASVLLVREPRALVALLSGIEEAVDGSAVTDMMLLGQAQLRPGVRILPTAPDAQHCFHAGVDAALRERMSVGLPETGGIIDAATWGQYFLGLDPKNARGRRALFVDLPEHAVDCRGVRLLVGARGCIRIDGEFGSVPIYALHVHSKDARVFRDAESLLRMRAAQLQDGRLVEFDSRAFISAATEALRRRWRRLGAKFAP